MSSRARVAGAGKPNAAKPPAPPRAAPYTARGGGRSSSKLTDEEVKGLMKLDDEYAKSKALAEELKTRIKETKQSTRDELDECKKEVRGGKRNAHDLERVEEETARQLEAVNVQMLGQIADDENMWDQQEDNEELKTRDEQLTVRLAGVEADARAAEVEFASAKGQREVKEKEVDTLKGQVEQLNKEEDEFCRSTLELEGVKARAERERSDAERASEVLKTTALSAIEKRNTADSEVASANQVRSRMQARVDRLSNNIKGILAVPAEVTIATLALKAGSPVTDLTVGGSNMAFSLDRVVTDTAALGAVFKSAAASHHAKAQVILTPASTSLLPDFAAECFEWAAAAVPEAIIAAVEIHEEKVRDLLVVDPAYHEKHVHGAGDDRPCELEGGFLKGVETGHASSDDRVRAALKVRTDKGVAGLRSGVTVAFHLRGPSKVLSVLCVPCLPPTKDDIFPHVCHGLARMSSDAKEGKAALRKTLAGRLALSSVNDSAHTSVVAVASPASTPQNVIDACRCLHRVMMVDLGVKPTA